MTLPGDAVAPCEDKYYLITEAEIQKYFFCGAGMTQEEQTGMGIRLLHRPITTNTQHAKNFGHGIALGLKLIGKGIVTLCRGLRSMAEEIREPPNKKEVKKP